MIRRVRHRGMRIEMDHPLAKTGKVNLIGNPVKFSRTPASYRHAPPLLGEGGSDIVADWLGLAREQAEELVRDGGNQGDKA